MSGQGLRFLWTLLTLAGAVACSPRMGGGGSSSPLLSSLQVSTAGDSVYFLLQVTNTSAAPVELEFRSGQSFDFLVLDGTREVWRWSNDQMFTQALRSQTLQPGETLSFEAAWRPDETLSGDYTAVGRLTAEDHTAEQRAQIRLP